MITIVYGPPGCGKTRNATKLAAQFGCKHVLDLDEFERGLRVDKHRFAEGGLMLLTNEGHGYLRAQYPKAKLVEFSTTAAALEQEVPY
jgi:hypothetical protein